MTGRSAPPAGPVRRLRSRPEAVRLGPVLLGVGGGWVSDASADGGPLPRPRTRSISAARNECQTCSTARLTRRWLRCCQISAISLFGACLRHPDHQNRESARVSCTAEGPGPRRPGSIGAYQSPGEYLAVAPARSLSRSCPSPPGAPSQAAGPTLLVRARLQAWKRSCSSRTSSGWPGRR
jgi:hypothetical protein